jgi:hypothetical protein
MQPPPVALPMPRRWWPCLFAMAPWLAQWTATANVLLILQSLTMCATPSCLDAWMRTHLVVDSM